MRRATHEGFEARASATYHSSQEKECALLVSRILRDPTHWEKHLKRSSMSTVLNVIYGSPPLDISADSDAFVGSIKKFMDCLAHACAPGAHLAETFPAMLHIPAWLAKWKREGWEWFEYHNKMFDGLFGNVKRKMVSRAAFEHTGRESRQLNYPSIGIGHIRALFRDGSHRR